MSQKKWSRRRVVYVVVCALVVGLAGLTRVTANRAAGEIITADRALMPMTRLGPPPHLRSLYRIADAATASLVVARKGAPAKTVGIATEWGPLVAFVKRDRSINGVSVVADAPTPNMTRDHRRTPDYRRWLEVQRLGVFVAATRALAGVDPRAVRVRWRGRLLGTAYVDQDRRWGLAFFVAQLDDGRDKGSEADERPPALPRINLQIVRGTRPILMRSSRSTPGTTRGFSWIAGYSTDGKIDVRLTVGRQPVEPGALALFAFRNGDDPEMVGVVAGDVQSGVEPLVNVHTVQSLATLCASVFADAKADAGFLGVTGHSRADDELRSGALSGPTGYVVDSIVAGGPARKAGIEPKDMIIRLGGHAVTSKVDLITEARRLSPRSSVKVRLLRGSRPMDVTVDVGGRPS